VTESESIERHPLFLNLPLRRASVFSTDGGMAWIESQPAILRGYPQITPDSYWHLTVAEHIALLAEIS